MFIDDSDINNSLTKAIIEVEKLPIASTIHQSPREALEQLKKEQLLPDYIFVDVNMPELSGFEFVEQFESMHPDAETAVFFLSGSVVEKDQQRAMAYKSVSGYFEKPFSLEIAEKVLN